MRRCTKCDGIKAMSDFYVRKSRPSGFSSACKACTGIINLAYQRRTAEKKNAASKRLYSKNREKILARTCAYQKANPELRKSIVNRWFKNHPDLAAAKSANRRASKIQRTPQWLTKAHHLAIKSLYSLARKLTKELAIPMSVDHIIPLNGTDVSGLHVPWNLQVISSSENSSKSNKLTKSAC